MLEGFPSPVGANDSKRKQNDHRNRPQHTCFRPLSGLMILNDKERANTLHTSPSARLLSGLMILNRLPCFVIWFWYRLVFPSPVGANDSKLVLINEDGEDFDVSVPCRG